MEAGLKPRFRSQLDLLDQTKPGRLRTRESLVDPSRPTTGRTLSLFLAYS
jgi:hypothetical protein